MQGKPSGWKVLAPSTPKKHHEVLPLPKAILPEEAPNGTEADRQWVANSADPPGCQ